MIFKGITRTYKHLRRYKQILDILARYGFGYFIERTGLLQKLSHRKLFSRQVKDIEKLSPPQRLRMALEDLGPTFIKLGQILSTRPDILPSEYMQEFVMLQDRVKEFVGTDAVLQFEESTGKSIEGAFDKFDEMPIASASIAQVHWAVLKDGAQVVVKVQRPNISKTIETDVEILFGAARFLDSKVNELKPYNLVGVVEEFSEAIQRELDFTKEAWNIEKFIKNFEDVDYVHAPKVYWDYTSKKVITMEYIQGTKINELQSFDKEERKLICQNFANATLKQIFDDGFFHADPHPGNVLITPDKKIAYIDFGQMGRLNKRLMSQIAELLIGIVEADEERIAQAFLDIGIIGDDANIEQFKRDIYDIIEGFHGKDARQVDIVQFLNEVFKAAVEHGIVMPPVFTLLIKVFVAVEGICRDLYEDFNIFEMAAPFVRKLIKERISVKNIMRDAAFRLRDTNRQVMALPSILNDFLRKANAGRLKLDVQPRGLEEFTPELNKMVNKLVASIIIAALLVGSALVLQINRGPFLYGFPIVGVLGFSFAAVLGIWLVITIIRSGKM